MAEVARAAAGWDVELSDEVVRWYVRLGPRDRAYADRALDRLASTGSALRMPHSRSLGEGLHELRLTCEGVSRRITYAFGEGREVTMLTTYRKERERERHEVDRAHRARARTKVQERPMERTR
ncbi:MAG TPA: type II toxin-antitoxin system RelE/ParE family toxin [Acidimicrobiales bacterium]|nr:type II toxin-antitoxin system RelE/ParE family toxin [Acidimicrobiales bacterium]